jgi:hypothetical protein
MARPFDIGGPATALRIYLILICCAARGETVTYEDLAQRAHQQDKGLLTPPLDLVAGWCKANGLPALTLLVVETVTGKPPAGLEAAAEQEGYASMKICVRTDVERQSISDCTRGG